MTKKLSQEQEIEKHLLKPGNTLTPLEALYRFQCFRLAAAMHRIGKRHTVKAEMVHEGGKSFARYSIEMAGKQEALELLVPTRPPDDVAEEQSEGEARSRLGMPT